MPTNAINDTGVKYLYDKLHGEIEPVAEAVSDSEVTIEGNPLNFNTLSFQNAKSTIIDIEPIQDLHGYDKPWTGGAGKNKLPMTIESIKALNPTWTWSGNVASAGNITFTILTDTDNNVICVKVNGTYVNTAFFKIGIISYANLPASMIVNGCPQGGHAYQDYQISCQANGTDVGIDLGSGVTINKSSIPESADLYIQLRIQANYEVSNMIFYPMLRLSTVTDDTFEPYTNISSISGHDQIDILGCGKNLIDTNSATQGKDINSSGEIVNASDTHYVTDYIPVIETKTLHQNRIGNWAAIGNAFYDKNKNFLSFISGEYLTSHNLNFTVPENAKYVRCTITDPIITMQLEYGTSETSYTAYQKSNNLTISFGQTVYGGQIDVEKGQIVVNSGMLTLNGSENHWTTNTLTSGKRRFICSNLPVTGYTTTQAIEHKNNLYRSTVSPDWEYDNEVAILRFATTVRIDILTEAFGDSLQAFTDYLSTHNMQVCYKFATPTVINLTPHTIKLLEGVNNISTDGDKITLTYRDGSVATLGDLTSAVDELDGKIENSKILTDTVTGDKYILVVANGVLDIQQISN